jgi:hypothetical protein
MERVESESYRVKLSQFRALCHREWVQGDFRGDVVALHLTDESYDELSLEALTAGDLPDLELIINEPWVPERSCGAALSTLSNPVTRSQVKVTGGSDWDWVEVRRGVPYALLDADAGTVPA